MPNTPKYKSDIFFITVMCPGIQLGHGQVRYSASPNNGKYPYHTVATFTCDKDFRREGHANSRCVNPGVWDNPTPTCSRTQSSNTLFCFTKYLIFMGPPVP